MLTGAMSDPARHVEHETRDVWRLLDVLQHRGASPRQPFRYGRHGALLYSARGRRLLVACIALFFPGIAVVVVAQRLPEARLVLGQQPQAAHPFGALPEIEVWHEQPRRPTMFG